MMSDQNKQAVRVQDIIDALSLQRNKALDDVVSLSAENAALKMRIEALEKGPANNVAESVATPVNIGTKGDRKQ